MLRRSVLRRKPPQTVPSVERAAVYVRDRVCFLYRMDNDHVCRDQWGNPHAPDDLLRMTVDHVSPYPGGQKGKRPPHSREHMVLMCWSGNVGGPSRAVREAERAYLATVTA